jgi:hypothetical protein
MKALGIINLGEVSATMAQHEAILWFLGNLTLAYRAICTINTPAQQYAKGLIG